MSFDVNEYKGFCIEVRTLLKGFPTIINEMKQWYPPNVDELDEVNIHNTFLGFREDYAEYEWLTRLILDDFVWAGDSWGVFTWNCPFKANNVYAIFDSDKLLDEQRTKGKTALQDSKDFMRLKRFMRKHKIPEEALEYHEWQGGG